MIHGAPKLEDMVFLQPLPENISLFVWNSEIKLSHRILFIVSIHTFSLACLLAIKSLKKEIPWKTQCIFY